MLNQHDSANDLKISVLAWALPRLSESEVVGSELRFYGGKRRADLAIASDTRLVAIEVKGPRDSLSTLALQVQDYLSMFLEVYVATTEAFVKQIGEMVPKNVGIISVVAGEVHVLRKAKVRKRLSAEQSGQWLTLQDLRVLQQTHKELRAVSGDAEKLRCSAVELLHPSALNAFALQQIRKRLQRRHDAFINELGLTPTLDDVQMLTIEKQIKQ